MSDIKIVLNKNVKVEDTHIGSLELTLTVIEAINITKNIFVSIFHPYSNYYGDSFYEFSNVAYYDELSNIKDTVEDSRHLCEVRRPCATASFSCVSDMQNWLNTVYADIQRLITQINTLEVTNTSEISITEDVIEENIVTATVIKTTKNTVDNTYTTDTSTKENETEIVTLSFDGK